MIFVNLGPIKFQCVECGIIFNFYGVTWKGFEMEIHPELGVAATYLEEDNIVSLIIFDILMCFIGSIPIGGDNVG